LATGKVAELAGVRDAVFVCDQSLLVTLGDVGESRVFKADGIKWNAVVSRREPGGISLASSPARPLVVYGDLDEGGQLWALDFSKGESVGPKKLAIPERTRAETEMLSPRIISVAFSPNGKWIVATTESNHVCVWDATSLAFAGCWLQGGDGIHFARGSDLICYLDMNNKGIVAELPQRQERVNLRGNYGRLRSLRMAPNARTVAGVSGVGTVHIWDARSGDELCQWPASESEVNMVVWSGSGRYLVTVGEGDKVVVWQRRFPEWWWGHLARPAVWGAIIAGAVACISLLWRRKKVLRPSGL